MKAYYPGKNEPFYITLELLNKFFIYPMRSDKVRGNSFCYIFIGLLLKFGYILMVIGIFLHIIYVGRVYDLNLSEDISLITGGVSILITMIKFTMLLKDWTKFFNEIIDCSQFGRPPIFDKITRQTNFISKLNSAYCLFGIMTYGLAAKIEVHDCKKAEKESGQSLFCGTYAPLWLPFKINGILLFIAQAILAYAVLGPTTCLYYNYSEIVEILISHIDLLKRKLNAVFQDDVFEKRIIKFRICVLYHQRIIKLGEDLNTLIQRNIGHMTYVWAIAFGCIGNQIFGSKPLGAILFLGGYVVALFWCSHAGQRLKDQSLSVAFVETNWYMGKVSEQKNFKFLLARSQIPLVIEAVPFGYYEYGLFILIMKTGYSYLTLMRNSS